VAQAQAVWDLKSDWSKTANPHDVWSYNANGAPVTTLVRNFTGDSFTPAQPVWEGGAFCPSGFSATQRRSPSGGGWGQPDWLIGDVIVHTASGGGYSDVTWTSPINGAVNISGAVWAVRDILRSNDWSLYHGATLLTRGNIGSGDPYSRSSPDFFALGSGGPGTLNNLLVASGETLQLRAAFFHQ